MSVQLSERAAAARALALDLHAVHVVQAFESVGIHPVLLKGAGLARRLYGEDPSRRRYSDIDLLVAPVDFDRAQHVLAQLGHRGVASEFPTDEWLPHERSWRLEPAGLTVDLHQGFAGVDDPATLHALLLSHAEPLDLEGGVVLVPDGPGCALLLGLHAASPGRGRKAHADLARGLERLPAADWAEAAVRAASTRSTEAFATGLRRNPHGALLAETLELDAAPTLLSRCAERLDLVLLHRALHAVRRVPGPRAKLRYVARRLVPTPDFLRLDSVLARRGRLGLVTAYVARPFRLLKPARREVTTRRRAGTARLKADPRRWTVTTVLCATWTLDALRRTRAELRRGPLAEVRLPLAPPSAPDREPTVRRTLRRRGATCLERSLVLQRWRAAHGVQTEVIVGVTAPASGFHAHAWLADDEDAQVHHAGMTVILRQPPSPEWLPRA